jgi:hypothetical protein
MNFQTYVVQCIRLLKENPILGKFEVIYACDEEGRDFGNVRYGPSVYCLDVDGEEYRDVNLKWEAEVVPPDMPYCWKCQEKVEVFNKGTHECVDCFRRDLLLANLVCIN